MLGAATDWLAGLHWIEDEDRIAALFPGGWQISLYEEYKTIWLLEHYRVCHPISMRQNMPDFSTLNWYILERWPEEKQVFPVLGSCRF